MQLDLDHVVPIADAPRPMERETAQSYVGRLAAFFGYSSISRFCTDFGLNRFELMSGQRDAVRYLARLAGADETELLRWTPERVSKGLFRLGEIDLPFDLASIAEARQCPLCAREAIAANPDLPPDLCLHAKGDWLGGFVDCCDRHGVLLVSRRREIANVRTMDISALQSSIFEDLEYLPVRHAELTSFECHALSVLRGEPATERPFVSGMSLDRLWRAAVRLGLDIAEHRGIEVDDRIATGFGFDLLAAGPVALREGILAMRDGPMGQREIWESAFRFLRHLDRDTRPETKALRAQVKELIYGDHELASGRLPSVITQEEIASREFVSAGTYDVPWTMVLAMEPRLEELDVRISSDRQDLLVRRVGADALFEGRAPLLTRKQVASTFGRPTSNALVVSNMLIDAGIISGSFEQERLSGMRPVFSLPLLQREMDAFLRPLPVVGEVPEGYVPLMRATQICQLEVAGALRLIASKGVKRVALRAGRLPLASIYVDPKEMLDAVFGDQPVLPKDAGLQLAISAVGVRELIQDGWLLPLKKVGRDDRPNFVIGSKHLADFARKYISAGEAAAMFKCRPKRIAQMGLVPAISIIRKHETRKPLRIVLYHRSEVKRLASA